MRFNLSHIVLIWGLFTSAGLNGCATTPVNPQPGDNIWHLVAAIGTELDQFATCLTGCGAIPITGPTVITTPGHYCLSKGFDVPAGNGITIFQADDTVLDLNNKTITGSGGVIGVEVINSSNVQIKNGTITNMIDACRIFNGSKCSISDCTFSNSTVGLALINANDNVIENCQAVGNSTIGYQLSSSSKNFFSKCLAINTGSTNPIAYGFVSSCGMCNKFVDCQSEDTHADNCAPVTCVGFNLGQDEIGSEITKCTVSNTTISSTPDANCASLYGIYFSLLF